MRVLIGEIYADVDAGEGEIVWQDDMDDNFSGSLMGADVLKDVSHMAQIEYEKYWSAVQKIYGDMRPDQVVIDATTNPIMGLTVEVIAIANERFETITGSTVEDEDGEKASNKFIRDLVCSLVMFQSNVMKIEGYKKSSVKGFQKALVNSSRSGWVLPVKGFDYE